MIKASQIDFSYGSKQLFNQFSLSLQENQITTLIGPNGSGKSTLFRLLTRAIRPSAGTITLDGQDIWQLAAKDFAKKVARSEEHTSELQSRFDLVCRLLLEKKNNKKK